MSPEYTKSFAEGPRSIAEMRVRMHPCHDSHQGREGHHVAPTRNTHLSVRVLDFRTAYDSMSYKYIRWMLDPVNIQLMTGRLEWLEETLWVGELLTKVDVWQNGGNEWYVPRGLPVLNPFYTMHSAHQLWTQQGCHGFDFGPQFYMDDLKLYARSSSMINSQIEGVFEVTEVKGLYLNLSKCGKRFSKLKAKWKVQRVQENGKSRHLGLRSKAPTSSEVSSKDSYQSKVPMMVSKMASMNEQLQSLLLN